MSNGCCTGQHSPSWSHPNPQLKIPAICWLLSDWLFLAWIFLLNSRLRYPRVYLTSLRGYLICLSTLWCPKPNSWSPPNMLFPFQLLLTPSFSCSSQKHWSQPWLHSSSQNSVSCDTINSMFKIYPEPDPLTLPWFKLSQSHLDYCNSIQIDSPQSSLLMAARCPLLSEARWCYSSVQNSPMVPDLTQSKASPHSDL